MTLPDSLLRFLRGRAGAKRSASKSSISRMAVLGGLEIPDSQREIHA